MRAAPRTQVRADRITAHEAARREVPAGLTDAIGATGAADWTIWRRRTDLFDLLRSGEGAGAGEGAGEGADAGLPVVGELP